MIPLSVPEIGGNEWKYIKECLDTNWVSSAGSYVDMFEERFRTLLGIEKAVVTVNGTAALHLALHCLGIKAGDEVIVPSLTFISPVNAVRYVGALPVFVDVCRDTYVMDVQKVEELITEKTKAILPVHLYGHPVDMDPLMDIAKKYHLFVIEDATESLGAFYQGKPAGTIGHAGCFSFNGNKMITTGGGGMLVTKDQNLGERVKYLSNQAKTGTPNGGFYHEEIGFNYRLPNLLAAMGVAQLERLSEYMEVKRINAQYYHQKLMNIEGLTLPCEKDNAKNAYWLYSIVVEDRFKVSRDALIGRLKEQGVESRPFFMPVHAMPPYRGYRTGNLEITTELSKKGINLPSSVGLTRESIDYICAIVERES